MFSNYYIISTILIIPIWFIVFYLLLTYKPKYKVALFITAIYPFIYILLI